LLGGDRILNSPQINTDEKDSKLFSGWFYQKSVFISVHLWLKNFKNNLHGDEDG